MTITIQNKHNIGDCVRYFENNFFKKGDQPQEVITTERNGLITKMVITINQDMEICWEYHFKDGTIRTDNTILI